MLYCDIESESGIYMRGRWTYGKHFTPRTSAYETLAAGHQENSDCTTLKESAQIAPVIIAGPGYKSMGP